MAYEPYASAADFAELFPDEEITEAALRTASRHVDGLTFNRIRAAGGIGSLTEFQRDAVREVVCRQAKFETDNAYVLENILSSYSINGVSMSFGADAWNVFASEGVAMQKDVYSLLEQTGLCCRMAG